MPRELKIAPNFHGGCDEFCHCQAAQQRHRNDHDGNARFKHDRKKTTDKSPRGYKNGAWSLKKKHGETESNSQ